MFGEAIKALEVLGAAIRSAGDIPKRRRKSYLDAVTEAFSLLEAALLLVQTRLGDLLHIQDDWELTDEQKRRRFVQELANLDNTEQWLKMEREVALCRSLRVVSGELDGAFHQIIDGIAVRDRDSIYSLMSDILERERMLANHISESFARLAAMASPAEASPAGRAAAWKAVSKQRRIISAERRSLIEAEARFLDSL